jgi:hypothetical protein
LILELINYTFLNNKHSERLIMNSEKESLWFEARVYFALITNQATGKKYKFCDSLTNNLFQRNKEFDSIFCLKWFYLLNSTEFNYFQSILTIDSDSWAKQIIKSLSFLKEDITVNVKNNFNIYYIFYIILKNLSQLKYGLYTS